MPIQRGCDYRYGVLVFTLRERRAVRVFESPLRRYSSRISTMVDLITSSSFCSVSFQTTRRSLPGLAGTSASRNSMVLVSPVFQCLKVMNFFVMSLISSGVGLRIKFHRAALTGLLLQTSLASSGSINPNSADSTAPRLKAGIARGSVRVIADRLTSTDTVILDIQLLHQSRIVEIAAIDDDR